MFGYVITNKPELKIREFEREVWQNRADDPYV